MSEICQYCGQEIPEPPVPEEEPEVFIDEELVCETCGGQGFTEENAGLVQTRCPDCEAGVEFGKRHGLPLPGEEVKTSDISKKPRELKSNEYLCTKCNKPHRETSKLGARHLKHKEG